MNDEVELAQFRIKYLSKFVDYFVVGESSETFSGKPKPLFFSNLSISIPNISIIEIPRLPFGTADTSRWVREEFQRDYLFHAANALHADSVLSFCDVDEIPSEKQLREGSRLLEGDNRAIIGLRTPTYLRRVNWAQQGDAREWAKAKLVITGFHAGGIRYRNSDVVTKNQGAHFSYLGMDEIAIRKKYAAFSHSELDSDSVELKYLLAVCDTYGVNQTGLYNLPGFGLLKARDAHSLGEVESAFSKMRPTYSGESVFSGSWATRMAASKWVTKIVRENTGVPSNFLAPNSFEGCLAAISDVLAVYMRIPIQKLHSRILKSRFLIPLFLKISRRRQS